MAGKRIATIRAWQGLIPLACFGTGCMTTYTLYVIGARDFLLISCSREVDTVQYRDTPFDL